MLATTENSDGSLEVSMERFGHFTGWYVLYTPSNLSSPTSLPFPPSTSTFHPISIPFPPSPQPHLFIPFPSHFSLNLIFPSHFHSISPPLLNLFFPSHFHLHISFSGHISV
eukprot:TRINITY_DN4178_c0_g1_i4.p1 TRINITY_DN4178_c0_g1~~TRINITY_DN4178_c0_g1_i4.p1  ORF type:complete len:111 (-),score=21.95 TRINITY_DN4178_c0_g1_i4:14-346(-)